MNKNEFIQITAGLIAEILTKFKAEGASPNVAHAIKLTMSLFASKLADRLFDCDELTIEK